MGNMSEDTARELTAKRLQLVGKIVSNGLADEGLTVGKAAETWPISRSQLYRIVKAETGDPMWYAEIEARLNYPRRLLRMVAEGRADVIEAMPDLDPVLRVWILGELTKIGNGGNGDPGRLAPRQVG